MFVSHLFNYISYVPYIICVFVCDFCCSVEIVSGVVSKVVSVLFRWLWSLTSNKPTGVYILQTTILRFFLLMLENSICVYIRNEFEV